jgi:CO/xanthine dehydrogenase FAD-binding subunit
MPQLKAYHRPTTIEETLNLLRREEVHTAVLAGGTYLNAHLDPLIDEVVDLQAAGLGRVEHGNDRSTYGAMVRLQTIVDDEQAPTLLRQTAYRAGSNTFRHMATIGGAVAGADWESELIAALLVYEAAVEIRHTHPSWLSLADFLKDSSGELKKGLITAVSLATTGTAACERVARTPADAPIVSAVARQDENGTIRLALCGVATTPVLVDPAQVASLMPPADFRGSTSYRRQMAITLSQRVLGALRDQ